MDSSPSELRRRLLELHPDLDRMSGHALGAIIREGHLRSVKAGQVVFEERTRCDGFPILLQGAVRVSKLAANGREILLYRIVPGEACVLTTGCLLGSAPYHGRGVAEEDLEVLVVPPALFSGLVEKEPVFRTYIFALFSERMAELMELVEAVAFQRLDRRLASLLLGKGGVIRTTHQHLAEELGSVREIVSRLLREFADQGLVALRREHIDILDARRLRLIAQS